MTEYQQGVYTGLCLGAPAIARIYRAICEHPGENQTKVAERAEINRPRVFPRIAQLEELGVVRLENLKHTSRSHKYIERLCWALEEPA